MLGQLEAVNGKLGNFQGDPHATLKARTQDLKIMLNQFDSLPLYAEMPKVEPEWTGEFAKDESYLKMITQGDKVYSYLK